MLTCKSSNYFRYAYFYVTFLLCANNFLLVEATSSFHYLDIIDNEMEWNQAANSNGPAADLDEVIKQNFRGKRQRYLGTTSSGGSASGGTGTGTEGSINGEQTCSSIENNTDDSVSTGI